MTLNELTVALSAAGIENAAGEARQLFCRFGGYTPVSLLGQDPTLDSPVLTDALRRRVLHEPLQYILEEVAFYREQYRVTPDCLIPRADTELLIDLASDSIPPHARFADLCTGSGCIAISLLSARTDLTAVAYDISESALALAQENAARNGVADRLTLHRADLLAEGIDGTYDALLSNPPYIAHAVLDTLAPELRFEPAIALDGGTDGMDFYRAILSRCLTALNPGGTVFFEIGYDQADAIAKLSAAHDLSCRIVDDYGGKPRCAVLKRKDN